MFTRMPSSLSARVARRPSLENGTLTITCSCSFESARPSSIMPPASSETTSALTGPRTSSQMRLMMSPGSPSSFASNDGFVVAPERMPHAAISSTSDTDPVSMKNLIPPPWVGSLEVVSVDVVLRPDRLQHDLRHPREGRFDPLLVDDRDSLSLGALDQVVLEHPDAGEALQVAVRRARRLGAPHVEVRSVRVLVPHGQEHLHVDRVPAQPPVRDLGQ